MHPFVATFESNREALLSVARSIRSTLPTPLPSNYRADALRRVVGDYRGGRSHPTSEVLQLAAAIATDTHVDAVELAPRYHDALVGAASEPAAELLTQLVPSNATRILDAGCGAGGYAGAFRNALPHAELTLVDDASVLALARDRLGEHRIDYVPGDLRDVRLAADFDVILACDLLHHLDESDASAVVARLSRSLARGGRLLIKDMHIRGDRCGPDVALHFDLNLALYTPAGRLHPPEEIIEWVGSAGLGVERFELASDPTAFVIVAG